MNNLTLLQASRKYSYKGGIYIIRCQATNCIYVGSADMFKIRLQSHLSALKANKHTNKGLQADFNKYGQDVFVVEYPLSRVVAGKADRTKLYEEEQLYLDSLRDLKICCYNRSFNCKKVRDNIEISPELKAIICENVKLANNTTTVMDTFEHNNQQITVICSRVANGKPVYQTINHI